MAVNNHIVAHPEKTGLNPDIFRLVLDQDGTILYASQTVCEQFGQDYDSIGGQAATSFFSLLSQETRPNNKSTEISALEGGIYSIRIANNPSDALSCHFDWIKTPDGQKFMVITQQDDHNVMTTSNDAPALNDNLPDGSGLDNSVWNKIVRMLGYSSYSTPDESLDIPGYSSLYNNTHALRHFLAMSDSFFSVCSPEGIIIHFNQNFCSQTGFTPSEINGMPLVDLIHDDDRPAMRQLFYSLSRCEEDIGDESCSEIQTRMPVKNGMRWVEWTLKRDKTHIHCFGKDITPHKEFESDLIEREQQLSEAQALAHLGHWRWIIEKNEVQWSEELYNIFGVEQDSYTPSLDNASDFVLRRDLGRLIQAFQRATIELNNYDIEFRIRRSDGEIRYLRCEGRCELNEEGELSALFGIIQDITEQTEHERALREAKDAAEQAYAAKSRFLANMSHELRTPLNAIIGFSEMMQRQMLGPLGSDRYCDYVKGIRESGEHLLDLISDILDMSKIEADKYDLTLEKIHIGKVINLAVHMMEGRAQEAGITVNVEDIPLNLGIKADRRAVTQMMLNLLSNAIKFSHKSGKIDIECKEREDYVSIRVRDDGIGIPAGKLKLITRPFEQADSHYDRQHEGSGLGLSITKSLVELHGGVLVIESKSGVGTTVTIRLPKEPILD